MKTHSAPPEARIYEMEFSTWHMGPAVGCMLKQEPGVRKTNPGLQEPSENEMSFHSARDNSGLPQPVGCVRLVPAPNGFSRQLGGRAEDPPGLVCAGDGLMANH
ncbi:hypothetical protein SBA4_5630002 [Candidatus Sulfopaludibacter sp. SbA4]|nr:hypothetical protein SBA4_5630002 [Candidatus Sulfopaludibacter sp. SbA4]